MPSQAIAWLWTPLSSNSPERNWPSDRAFALRPENSESSMSTTTMPAQKQDHQPGVESKMRPEPDYEPRYPGVGKLKDKVALITGGDSGIGRAVAVAMARQGAKIAI